MGIKMENINYQKELEKQINQFLKENRVPTLLLHSCCAPCSSYCLEYLSNYFLITVFFYNPNISPSSEYEKRVEEQKRLIASLKTKYPVQFIEGNYDPKLFFEIVKGMEEIPEGGERCFACYELRQKEAAVLAKEKGFDYFTTTLSVSPYKNAKKLNEIGKRLELEYQVAYLQTDFKKKNGYKRSIELSEEYQLYRQNYCGCIYSKEAAEKKTLASELKKDFP